MRTTIISFAVLFFFFSASAQWTTSGSNIYYNSGNVGIGITNPTAKLEISDAGNSSLRVGITSNRANTNTQLLGSSAVVAANNSSVSTNGAVAWDFYNNGSSPSWSGVYMQHTGTAVTGNQYGVLAGNQGTLVFQNVSNGVIASNGANIFISPLGTVSTCFLTNGNVGIGTTNPGTFKLAVEGKIGAREIKVTLASFADYVFERKYNLLPLNELEKYIQQNKRLPNIPSTKEVEENNGIELGDMSVKLLEKIEELTLYIIQLKKENDKLKAENVEIKEELKKLSEKK